LDVPAPVFVLSACSFFVNPSSKSTIVDGFQCLSFNGIVWADEFVYVLKTRYCEVDIFSLSMLLPLTILVWVMMWDCISLNTRDPAERFALSAWSRMASGG